LERLCVRAMPLCEDAQRDVEAELLKARVLARLTGDAHFPRLGHFEVLRCLGRGGMSSVFEARDRAHGQNLALKVLHEPNTHGLSRLRRELRSLADISHPGLVTLGELYEDEGVPFFTMELVPGRSLQQLIDSGHAWELTTLEHLAAQLIEALRALHARGVAHGDIKPSNLMVRPDGHLVVVDFGVAHVLSESTERRARRGSGTLAYMAPERLRGGHASPQADWYAVGALLRELLDRAPDVPRSHELRRVVTGLLAPSPERRSAAPELACAIGRTLRDPVSLLAEDDGVFVGRDAELSALIAALTQRTETMPYVCRVRGEPGIGKTALLERFAAAATARGALVLSGRCYEQENTRFKGFDMVIDGLARHLLTRAALANHEHEPAALEALLQVFPGLARAGFRAAERGSVNTRDMRATRQLAFSGLICLLRALAAQTPLVITLDDWQWADDDGTLLLRQLMAADLPCLLLISQREGHSLARPAQLDLELMPMSDADATQLVQALAQNTPPEAQAALAREAAGNPLVLRALLGARPAQGQVRDYGALVREVVAELDDEPRELLRLAALAGQPVSMELLARAAQLPSRPWQAVARLKKLRLLRSVAHAGSRALAPHHDRVREAISGELEQSERRARHAALAEAAEQLGIASAVPELMAEQHFRAGHPLRAAYYAELAGDQARDSAALSQAQRQYMRALEAHAPARPAQLVAKLADASALVGDVQRAAPLLLEAAERVPEQAEMLRLRAAEMFLLAGEATRGMQLLCPVLRARGIPLPVSEYAAGLLAALSLVRVQLSRCWKRQAPAASPDPRIETTFRLGFLFQLTQPMHGYRLLLWSTERALHHGTAPQRARALAQLAVTQKALGLGTLAAQDAMLAQALSATSSDAVEHTFVLACKILIAFAGSDCRQTLACAAQTRQFVLQHRVPVDWVLGPITALEVSTRVLAGQFAELRASRPEVERESQALGNRALRLQVDAAHAWAELAVGRTEAMRAFSERAMREWVGVQPLYGLAMWGEAHRRLYCGDLSGAAQLLRVEKKRYARSGISRVQSWSLALTLLWGTIALRLSRTPDDAYARMARRQLRALMRARERCASPSAALLQAGLYRRVHDAAAACDAYTRARHGFAALGMCGYAAAAAFRAAELRGERCPEQADRWFAQQRIADPAAWTNMYAPNTEGPLK